MAVTNNTHRISALRKPASQIWIILQYCLYACHNSRQFISGFLHPLSCLCSGNPFAFSIVTCNLSICCHSIFHNNIRRLVCNIMKEYRIQGITFFFQDMCFYLYPCFTQNRNSFSCYKSIWVIRAYIHFLNPMFYNGLCTRWLFSIMTTRFQCYIHFCTFCILCCVGKCVSFCMKVTIFCMISFSYYFAIFYDYCSY